MTYEETRKKMSENNKFKKKVICIEAGSVFDSLAAAAEFAGVSRTSICNCLKGKTKISGGYHWKYYEEDKVEAVA